MARFPYGQLRRETAKLIRDAGQSASILKPATRDPLDPDDEGSPGAVIPCKAVEDEFTSDERENTLIQATDKKMIVTLASDYDAPTSADRFQVGDEKPMEIVMVKRVKPGPVVILYEIAARS